MTTVATIANPDLFGLVPPATTTCPCCGKPQERIKVTIMGKEHEVPCWGSCHCEASREKYDSLDRKDPPTKTQLYRLAGVGPEYQAADCDASACTAALAEGRNVYVVGPNGTGKSMLAARTAMDLVDAGERPMFANAAMVTEEVRNGFDADGTDLYERMCEAPVLLIDDFGKGNPSDWECSFWYSVAEARNAAGLPTMVTTNYDGGELVRRLSSRGDPSTAKAIVSRLRGGAHVVKTEGPDRRLGK